MDVTKSNFYQLIPDIQEAIDESDFICIDCELTGLNTGNDINAFDTQKQYYEKVRKHAKSFLVIQYGLCMFRYDKDAKCFKQQAYNFYIFPTSGNRHAPDHRFLCQSSSIDFLVSCGFDFNKLFSGGIPYLNSCEEDKYKDNLADKQKTRASQIQNNFSPDSKNISMTIEEHAVVDNVVKEIEEFIISDLEEYILPKCNAYIRRLIYQEAQKTIMNKASLETRVLNNKDRILVVTRLKDKATQEEEHRKTIEKEYEEFQKCIGFSTVIKMIVESEKLVVGHNMCLDLLHTIDQFLIPLPYDYEDFKELANISFSKVLDTKYMCSVAPLKNVIDSSVLGSLFNTIQKSPFCIPNIEIEENKKGYSINSDRQHEAGYDAYATGVCFLTMWNYLHNEEKTSDSFLDVSLLQPYINKLFLMRLQDSPYIHLGGTDPVPSREHVVYLSFPKTWKLNDIVQLFSPFGNVYVSWIDDHSAFVSLQKRDQISIALNTLSQSDIYTIMSYTDRQNQVTGQISTPTASTSYTSSQKKRSADNSHASIKKRKTSIGDILKKKNNDSGKDFILNNEVKTSGKLMTQEKTLTNKQIKKTFNEPCWD